MLLHAPEDAVDFVVSAEVVDIVGVVVFAFAFGGSAYTLDVVLVVSLVDDDLVVVVGVDNVVSTGFFGVFVVTVAILGSLGQELDPILDLGHTAVHTVAGALTPIADNSNLGESKYIE